MRLECVACTGEVHEGSGPGGEIVQASVSEAAEALVQRYAGQAQTLYMDPPFYSNQRYVLKLGVGESGWRTGKPSIELPAYDDRWESTGQYLEMMRGAFTLAHTLLKPEGAFFVHIDTRMNARFRLMLEEIFGESNFVNEIVWVYQTGGRSKRYFSRKHDTILFFRKSGDLYFDISAVAVSRATRRNHMKRAVDADGRAYRSIRVGGKEYRYYDDAPAYPSDVWDDVSHLQQKDPQRSGFDSQKPIALLERIIGCSSRPGDLVCDLFAGSGTTLVAAAGMGRAFLGVDVSDAAVIAMRKRLLEKACSIRAASGQGAPDIQIQSRPLVGFYEVSLTSFALEKAVPVQSSEPLSELDQWSVGYLRDGRFHGYAHAARTKAAPVLPERLELPVLAGDPAILTVDILGRRLVHRIWE